ncbi:MAG: PQQ-binding-like beta-propeller repeat protein, partial [Chloroflexota bacterium]
MVKRRGSGGWRLPGAARWLLPLALCAVLLPAFHQAAADSSTDWPLYLHDVQRTANQPQTAISTANAAQLTKLWSFQTGGIVGSSPIVVAGNLYVGAWDGYEYSLNAATGALNWKTYLGVDTPPTQSGCFPASAGVSSAPAVQNGVLYLGGGDNYFYALDAASGAVLWKVFSGSTSQGYYNWSSPLVYNGYAYVGTASFGDCPLVPGQVLMISLSTHQITSTFAVVTPGQFPDGGGGVWTSPSLDPATNTLYVTTGTHSAYGTLTQQPYAQAVLALDATSLTLKASWQIPLAMDQASKDADWGVTPILFDDQNGRHMAAAINKDGYAYGFDRSNLAAGPVWQDQFAQGGECPTCGDGSAASSAFGQGTLYMAGGITTINGTQYHGSVRAINPATGQFVWQHGTPDTVIAALAYTNGLIVDGAGANLEVLNASTGQPLWNYWTGGTIYGAPSVANGHIYAGSVDHSVYAFGLAATATATATPSGGGYAGTIEGTANLQDYYRLDEASGAVLHDSKGTRSGSINGGVTLGVAGAI